MLKRAINCLGGINSRPVAATPNTSVMLEFTPSSSVALSTIKSNPHLSPTKSKLAVKFKISYASIASTIGSVSYTHLTLPTILLV